MKKPNSRRNLDIAIARLAGQEGSVAARRIIANALVGHLLSNGAVKGGSSLKIRFGDAMTRATTDLDAARASSMKQFVSDLEESLSGGWEGFTGRVVVLEPATPKGVPSQYVMQPLQVKLSYNEAPWCTVDFEVGHDEIGDADNPDLCIPEEANALLRQMSFPELPPIPLMPLHYQIAQKLHGLSEDGSKRAHDLIDLQVIMLNGNVDLNLVRTTCERLFAYRKMQQWPPTITAGQNWGVLYADQLLPEPVIQDMNEAIAWANDLIRQICGAH